MPLGKVIYNLECGHSVLALASFISGKLYCPYHQSNSPITGVAIMEWQAKCHTCRYARWAGLQEQTANVFANGHVRRNSGHRVTAQYIVNPDAEKTQAKIERWRVRSEH